MSEVKEAKAAGPDVAASGPKEAQTTFKFRISVAEMDKIKEKADQAGLTVSSYIRRQCLERPIFSKEQTLSLAEIRRVGGLLKHSITLAKGEEEGHIYIPEARVALKEIELFLAGLGSDDSQAH